MLKPGVFQY